MTAILIIFKWIFYLLILSIKIIRVIKEQVEGLLIFILKILAVSYAYFLVLLDDSFDFLEAFKVIYWVYLANIGISASMIIQTHQKIADKDGMIDFILNFIDYFLRFLTVFL